jgi:hypothetical protein
MSRSDDTSATGVAIAKSIRTNFAPVECSSVRVAGIRIALICVAQAHARLVAMGQVRQPRMPARSI